MSTDPTWVSEPVCKVCAGVGRLTSSVVVRVAGRLTRNTTVRECPVCESFVYRAITGEREFFAIPPLGEPSPHNL
jgi:hypothetical protein